ncbi:hypothetical protein GCM10023086_67550 [Streptomyces venetus]|uniref:Uncharacterized protein n=1 Tax=Streptomyces venetus TaxID=1701086 RepID=A0ABP8H6P6_9ACTN
MCRRAVCHSCRKVTYEGCGRHVEQVLASVPTPQRCMCESAEGKPTRAEPDAALEGGAVRHTHVPRHMDGSPDRSKDGWWTRIITWMKSPA